MRCAACLCGQLSAECDGEPGRISVCHCLNCQRRSGSAFAAQARFPVENVRITGEWREYVRVGEGGGRLRLRFCPQCGTAIAYEIDAMPGVIAIPLGTFADPDFPPPHFSVFENRKHSWVEITGHVEHD